MTPTSELALNIVKVNWHTKYLGWKSFLSKVTVSTHRLTALLLLLKWSVTNSGANILILPAPPILLMAFISEVTLVSARSRTNFFGENGEGFYRSYALSVAQRTVSKH